MKKNLLVLLFVFGCIGTYAQVLLPYTQDFEDTTFPPTGWTRFHAGDSANWVRNTTVSAYGRGAASTSFDNYDTNGGGTYGMFLPTMDFSSVTNPYIRFDYAYTTRGPQVSDALGVWASINTSSIGQNLKHFSFGSLVTADSGNGSGFMFIPQFFEWKTITLPMAGFAGRSLVRLTILDSCMNGNVLYIDNVVVFDSSETGVNTIGLDDKMSIYPNPFDSQINVVSNEAENIARVDIYNELGDVMVSKEVNNAGILINNLSFMADGIYVMRVYSKEGILNKKIVKCTGR